MTAWLIGGLFVLVLVLTFGPWQDQVDDLDWNDPADEASRW